VDAGLMYDKPPMTVMVKVSGMFYIYMAKWVELNAEVACH